MKQRKTKAGPFDALRSVKAELAKREAEAKVQAEAPARRAATPPAASRRGEPEDEALLFHRLFAGVTPLDRSPGRLPRQDVERSPAAARASTGAEERARHEADAVHEHLRSLVEDRPRFEVADDGAHVEGRRVDLPVSALRRLRRGALPIDARLDLHGTLVGEAHAKLDAFVRTTRARGERCVLVIHGKGTHSPGGIGVLRGEITAWLSQGTASEHVAAFATARSADGGEGALYVLLRR